MNSTIYPTVSIITVTYNAEKYIEKTILSIINQTFRKYIEYIIVDGNSSDNTNAIISKYSTQINQHVVENDNGLYDAMNKGIKKSTGEYLWFINAGDEIYKNTTLENILTEISSLKQDVLYGDTVIINEKGDELYKRRLRPPKILTWKSFTKGMLVSHQSIIIRKGIAPLFNLKYNYSADFDWVVNCLKDSKNIKNTQQVLSKFLTGGQTDKTIIPGLFERLKIMIKHYGIVTSLFSHIYIFFRLIIKSFNKLLVFC